MDSAAKAARSHGCGVPPRIRKETPEFIRISISGIGDRGSLIFYKFARGSPEFFTVRGFGRRGEIWKVMAATANFRGNI